MKRKPDRTGPLHLIVQAASRTDEPIGIHAAPPYLLVDVWRLPGETQEQLATGRCRWRWVRGWLRQPSSTGPRWCTDPLPPQKVLPSTARHGCQRIAKFR